MSGRLDDIADALKAALEGLEDMTTETFTLGGDINVREMIRHAIDLLEEEACAR